MFKKALALLMAVTMLLSMSFVVSAEGETITASIGGGYAIKDEIFDINFNVENIATLVSVEFDIFYNPLAVVPVVDAEGTPAAVGSNIANLSYLMAQANGLSAYGAKIVADTPEAGTNRLRVQAGNTAPATLAEDGKVMSVRFKALDDTKEMNFSFAINTLKADSATQLKDAVTDNTDLTAFKVIQEPDLPTIDGDVTITGAQENVETPAKATVAYTLNDGAKSGETYTDISTIEWFVGDATTAAQTMTADEAGAKEFAITAGIVGEDLKVVVTPEVERGIKNVNEDGAKEATVVVKADADYVPTAATVTLPAELIATIKYAPTVTFDNTYALADYESTTYAWYIVEASETVDSVEDALAVTELGDAVKTTKVASFDAEYRDNYAVVVVTPVAVVAGETRTGEAVKAAALIKGEPPVVDASAVKTDKELNVNKAIKVVEGKDFTVESKSPEGGLEPIAYAWYLATAEELAEFDPEGKTAVSTKNSYTPVQEDLGKFVILYITATDDLGIATTVEVKYTLPIAKATGSAPAAGNGASLTVGGNNNVDEPGTEDPGTEDPKVDPQDPQGTANDKGAAAFTDVDKEKYAWAYDSIDALAKAGVIKGMSETTFEPEATATNAQIIALAVRIAGLKAEEGTKTDIVAEDHWVQAEMAIAEANEILAVFGETVKVDEATTREVAFTLLYNALKAAGVELPETAEAIEYTDAASIDAACVEAITALTKAGIVNGMGDGTLAPKATITRAQLAKILGMANALIAK